MGAAISSVKRNTIKGENIQGNVSRHPTQLVIYLPWPQMLLQSSTVDTPGVPIASIYRLPNPEVDILCTNSVRHFHL